MAAYEEEATQQLPTRNNTQIRQNNIRLILNTIKNYGPISKRGVQAVTKLSWGSVSVLAGKLEQNGYILPTGKQSPALGRKANEYNINPDDHYLIGIDMNNIGVRIHVTDLKGTVVYTVFQSRLASDYAGVMDQLFAMVDEVFVRYANRHLLSIGMAVQGVVDVHRGVSVSFPHLKDWKNVPLRQLFEERYAIPCYILHDPDCIMIAERQLGLLGDPSLKKAALVRVDKGIGLSLLLNGRIFMDNSELQGESSTILQAEAFSHILVNREGPVCKCGNRGCLHVYSSERGALLRFFAQVDAGVRTMVDLSDRQAITVQTLVDAALQGDALCRSLFEETGTYLGIALSTVFNLLAIERIVLYLDNCMVQAKPLFEQSMRQEFHAHACLRLSEDPDAVLAFSSLGPGAAALGAALYASEKWIQSMTLGDKQE